MVSVTVGGLSFEPIEMRGGRLTIRKGLYGWEIIDNRTGFYWTHACEWRELPGSARNMNFDDAELDPNVRLAESSRALTWTGTGWE